MLKVRLQRVGRKNDPSFRMVVIEGTKGPKSRDYIEMLGSHNPRLKQTTIDGERVKHWIAQGAQVSDTVHNILVSEKVIEGKKVNPLGKKTPIVSEKEEEEKKEAPKAEASEESQAEEAPAEAPTEEEPPTEETKEEEAPAEEPKEESKEEEKKEEPAPEEKEESPSTDADDKEASAEEPKEEEEKKQT